MASEIRVNSLTNRSGLSTVSITDTGAVIAGMVTATSFSGPLTGDVTGNITATNGTFSGNLSVGGVLTYDDVTNIDSVGVITARSGLQVTGGNVKIGPAGNPGFAEGSGLEVERAGAATIRIEDTSSSSSFEIQNTSGVIKQRLYNNQPWTIEYGSGERLRITSTGKCEVYKGTSATGKTSGSEAFTVGNGAGNKRFSVYPDGTAVIGGQGIIGNYNILLQNDGTIITASGMQAASVNLQSSSTASWFQTGANYGGADYVWAAKNTQTNTWHSGLKTSSDLYLGGDITGTRNISLNGSNGSAAFTGKVFIGSSYSGGEIFQLGKSSGTSYTGYYNGGTAHGFIGHADQLVTAGGATDFAIRSTNNLVFATNGANERLRITSGGVVKINNPSMVGGTNAANALLQIKATGQYDGLVFGNTYSQGAIGTNSQGALIYTGNAAPANLGGGLKHTHIWYSGSSGGGGPSEKMSLSTDGTLYLGPYDAPGSYTSAVNNVPYSIKVAPYGWQHHSEIAAISMGNHSGSTGNDDGEIVFKTAKDVHSSTTGLVERLRIDSNGDAIFYGNPSIDATDLYYTNTYSTNGWSTSNWYTVVPHGLTSNSTYLVALVWDWGGSHGSPYYVATQQLYSTVNGTNGTGSENELTPMVSTHTGSTGARIRCRVLAQSSGTPAMQVNMNYTMGSSSYLKVKVWKMTFLNRS